VVFDLRSVLTPENCERQRIEIILSSDIRCAQGAFDIAMPGQPDRQVLVGEKPGGVAAARQ